MTLLCLASCSLLYPIILVNLTDKDIVFEATFNDLADTSLLNLRYVPTTDLTDKDKLAGLYKGGRKLSYQLVDHHSVRILIPSNYTVHLISKVNGKPDYFRQCKITVDEKNLVLDNEALLGVLERRRSFDIIGMKNYLKIRPALFR